MNADSLSHARPPLPARCRHWLMRQWRLGVFLALTVVATLSPSCYRRQTRHDLAVMLCLGAWRMLPGYLLACILIGTVLTHIVNVTSAAYGLSHLALEAVIRSVALELIPLAAVLFVALYRAPETMQRLARLSRASGAPAPDYRQLLPCVVGNAGAVLVLAVFGAITMLVVAYLVIHGASQWALTDYARLIVRDLDQTIMLVFAVKLLLFAGVIGLAPATIVLDGGPADPSLRQTRVMIRLLAQLILIEIALLILPRL